MKRIEFVKLGLCATGGVVFGNYWVNRATGGAEVVSQPMVPVDSTSLVNYERLSWQEITADDRVRFPETVNRFAEHFWAGTTEAIRAAKDRGDFPGSLSEERVFSELIVAVRAVATIESFGNPKAVSESGAMGVMQLVPKIGLTINVGEDESILFDPQVNIFRGCWYYSVLWFNAYKELGSDFEVVSSLAAARYNGNGERKLDGSNWSCETREYVKRFIETRLSGSFTSGRNCG